MNAKAVAIFAATTAALTAAAVLLTANRGGSVAPGPADAGASLAPDLAERSGDIARIEILSDSGRLELVRTDDRWTLPARDGYPAELDGIRALAAELRAMQLVERKTASAANHERLGLNLPEPPADSPDDIVPPASDAPVRVRMLDADGTPIADIVLGNRSPSGVFVRAAGSDQTWLAAAAPNPMPDPENWYDQRPVQAERDAVRSVTVTHPDGEVVRIVPSDDDGFELDELPEGTEPVGPWQAGQPAGALGFLTVEGVRSAESLGFADAEHTVVSYELDAADDDAGEGETPTLTARVAEIDGRTWATFEAGGPGADDVNGITEGWAYALPTFTAESLTVRTADLVEAVETPIDEPSGPVAPFEVPEDIPDALAPPGDG